RPGEFGIRNSVALKFDIFAGNPGETDNSTGIFTDGRSPTIRLAGLPPEIPDNQVPIDPAILDLKNANRKIVDLSYHGTTLRETIPDTVTMRSFTTTYTVNIRSFVGSDTAFVGFGGGTGGLTAVQDIEAWTFMPGTTLPGAPTNLVATAIGSSSVNLG